MSAEGRGVRWRRQLGLLPSVGADPAALEALRRAYYEAKATLMAKPQDGGDLAMDNPLSPNPDSSWAKFFKTEARLQRVGLPLYAGAAAEAPRALQELGRVVDLDLTRLHPGDAFFSAEPVQARPASGTEPPFLGPARGGRLTAVSLRSSSCATRSWSGLCSTRSSPIARVRAPGARPLDAILSPCIIICHFLLSFQGCHSGPQRSVAPFCLHFAAAAAPQGCTK